MISNNDSPTATPAWYSEPCLMGIDEAGRGPVLGPMVYACAYAPVSQRDALAKKEFADSKTLTEERREALFAALGADASIGAHAEVQSAAQISAAMLGRQPTSLNQVAMDATFRLIEAALAAGVNLAECYVDTVGDADRHRDRLAQRFPCVAFTVCPKADALYPIVSAASIVAKVTRDRALRDFAAAEAGAPMDRDWGCGYPGDAATREWLQRHAQRVFGFPSLVRFSWATCAPVLERAGAAAVEWECEADAPAGQRPLALGGRPPAPAAGAASCAAPGRHSLFRSRRLQRVVAGL